ncbi:hypothetical protein H5410_031612 [Solanum commersonii]|uniref:Uncharacterized protein n=1 Tax=Solanum commersonii TaxID=4109 RepID=A0A9J5YIS9_SOLCO|nr:hypothetical protein H5410_031612 [Solanum commersonii]
MNSPNDKPILVLFILSVWVFQFLFKFLRLKFLIDVLIE